MVRGWDAELEAMMKEKRKLFARARELSNVALAEEGVCCGATSANHIHAAPAPHATTSEKEKEIS